MDENAAHLMFLTGKQFEQGKAIRGGALVTDVKTRPVEFRCTSPIRPNAYQRVLYGGTLDEYICVDLIGIPLVNKTREDVALVLVDDERFLEVRPYVDVPMLLVTRSTERESGVSFRTYPGFESEKVVIQTLQLEVLSSAKDLLEPFERVHLALDQAHMQGIGDKSD